MLFRTYFHRKLIRASLTLPIGFVLYVALQYLGGELDFPYLGVIGFVGSGVVFIYLYRVACPHCRKNISFLANLSDATNLNMSKSIHFCPFCGINLDCEVNARTGEKQDQ